MALLKVQILEHRRRLGAVGDVVDMLEQRARQLESLNLVKIIENPITEKVDHVDERADSRGEGLTDSEG